MTDKQEVAHDPQNGAVFNHSLNGSSDSINSDLQFLWGQANFKPHKINTPEPIDKKIGTIDYIRDLYWRLLGKWVKYNKNYFCLFILFKKFNQATGQTRGWIFTRDSSKDVKSSKNVPFRVIKFKFNFKPLFIPQNRQILAQNGTVFYRKCLTMRALKSKLPLIIIVAP